MKWAALSAALILLWRRAMDDGASNMLALCEYFGIHQLKVHRENIIGCCPFHGETRPSWGVSFVKMVHNCYSCGMRGSVFHMIWNLLPDPSVRQVQDILERFRLDLPDTEEEWGRVKEYTPIPYHYLDAYPVLKDFRGHSTEFLEKNNFRLSTVDGRVIVPFFVNGEFLGMLSHGMNPKTVPLYDMPFKRNLFIPKTAIANGQLILCEGFADALRINSYGWNNVAALNGTSFTQEQELQVRNLITGHTVVCMFDNDRGGDTALKNVCSRLTDLCVMDARNYGAQDPDKMTRFGFFIALQQKKIVL